MKVPHTLGNETEFRSSNLCFDIPAEKSCLFTFYTAGVYNEAEAKNEKTDLEDFKYDGSR